MNINTKYSHRTDCKTVKINDRAGAEVIVKQKKHAFLFGCSEFTTIPYINGEYNEAENLIAEERYERMADLLNSVTLPFYWGRFEEERGKPINEKTKKAAE